MLDVNWIFLRRDLKKFEELFPNPFLPALVVAEATALGRCSATEGKGMIEPI
jgi:hypothetical protein